MPQPCSKCGKCFKSFKRENEHDKYCGEIACGTCGKTFNSKKNLIPREAKHARDFVCTSCDKSFQTLSKLSRHMVVHDKSLCVRCEKCGKEFSR